MDVANRTIKLLIDTGSEITIVASDVIDNTDEIETTNVALTGLSGNQHAIPTEGTVRAKIFIKDATINETIYIIQRKGTYLESEEFDGFLGREFLKRHGATIDLHNDTIQLRVTPVYELRNNHMTTSRNSVSRPDIEFKTCNGITCSKCEGRVENLTTKRLFRGMRIHKVDNDRENERSVQIIIRPQPVINMMNNGEAQTNSRNERENKNKNEFRAQNHNEERKKTNIKTRKDNNNAQNKNATRNIRENKDKELDKNEIDIEETFLAELFENGNMILEERREENNDEEEPDLNDKEKDEDIERLLNFESLNVKITDDAREFLKCFKNIATESASKYD